MCAGSGPGYASATSPESISSNTDRCNNVTERTSLKDCFTVTTIPSIPASGPAVILPVWPGLQKGYGDIAIPASMAL